jgi:hypothetical protein
MIYNPIKNEQRMSLVMEHMPSKCKTLRSDPSTTKKKKCNNEEEEEEKEEKEKKTNKYWLEWGGG